MKIQPNNILSAMISLCYLIGSFQCDYLVVESEGQVLGCLEIFKAGPSTKSCKGVYFIYVTFNI